MNSKFGRPFDSLAERWAVIEGEHDRIHPDRSRCGGVGGCTMMAAAYDLRAQMIEALEDWRTRRGARRSDGDRA